MLFGQHPYRRHSLIAALLFCAAFALYVVTLAPSVVAVFDDSLEFQLVTYQAGIAHPTGYPLYTLLGWLFTRLPMWDVAYRVNLMSAVFGALTVAAVYLVGLELAVAGRGEPGRSPGWTVGGGAIVGAAALAVSPVFWSQATVAEVYTPNSAIVALLIWLLLRLANDSQPLFENPLATTGDFRRGLPQVPDRGRSEVCQTLEVCQMRLRRHLVAVAFLFGLGLAHHRTVLLLAPAAVWVVWRVARMRGNAGLLQRRLVLVFLAPLLLYLYLPLRGHIGSLDGSYTNTLAGFVHYVTASGYGAFFFQNPFSVERGATFYVDLFVQQFGWLGIAAGLLGLGSLIQRRLAGSITAMAFASYGVFNLVYRVADIEVFFIPLFLLWAVWLGKGCGWLLVWLRSRLCGSPLPKSPVVARGFSKGGSLACSDTGRAAARFAPLLVVLLLVGQVALILSNNFAQRDRSGEWTIHDYGLDIMKQPLPSGAAIVGIQGEITLVRYFQATQGLRPDLRPVAVDQPDRRLVVVTHLMDQGYAVYLTRDLAGAPERWSLSAQGPLIRVRPHPVLIAREITAASDTRLAPEIALHSYDITRPPSHNPLPPLRLNLLWHALAPIARDLKVSARLLAPDGQPVAQADAVPVHFAYPTTRWRPDEYVGDVHDLTLPDRLLAGQYTPLLILYDPFEGAAEVGRLSLPPIYLP